MNNSNSHKSVTMHAWYIMYTFFNKKYRHLGHPAQRYNQNISNK